MIKTVSLSTYLCRVLQLQMFDTETFCGAGGEVQDCVSVVSGQQQGGYVFKPLLHPRIWQGSLPCCQHAPPRALGSVLHPLEPTHTTAGRTAHVFAIVCCKLAWINCELHRTPNTDIWISQCQNSEITAQKQL